MRSRRVARRAGRAHFLVLAAVLAGLATGSRARAQQGPLAWTLSDQQLYELEMVEDGGARRWVGDAFAPVGSRLLCGNDFPGRKVPDLDPATLSGMVFRLALTLPDDAPEQSGTVSVNETFHLRSSKFGDIAVKGTEQVVRDADTTTLTAVLALTQDGSGNPFTLKDPSTLTLERTFDQKAGTIPEARFDIVINANDGAKDSTEHHTGKVRFLGNVNLESRLFLTAVSRAIDRGKGRLVQQLKAELARDAQNKIPYAQGRVALLTFALLRSGVPPEELADAFDFMSKCDFTEVYSVSLYIMCLEARSVKREHVPPQDGGHTVARFKKLPIPPADRKIMSAAAAWLLQQRHAGQWSYGPGGRRNGGGDRSNSQFATLALHCASMDGVDVDPEAFSDVAVELALDQESDGDAQSLKDVVWTPAAPPGIGPESDPVNASISGKTQTRKPPTNWDSGTRARGWAYRTSGGCKPGSAYESMTGAGLSSAAIVREALRRAGKLGSDAEAATRRSILDGIAWFSVNWKPLHETDDRIYYRLYSVEKAMELCGVESFAGHDWWREGCAQLLTLEDRPRKGSWGPETDTALALLFLNRATLPARIAVHPTTRVVTGPGETEADTWDQVEVPGLGFVRLREVIDVLGETVGRDARDATKIADKAFDLIPEEHRPDLVAGLIPLLDSPERDIQQFARKALRTATGGIDDPVKARTFAALWADVARAGASKDYGAIPAVRSALVAKTSTLPLKQGALLALARLHAVEALGDVIAELTQKDPGYHRAVAQACVQLADGEKCPFDPNPTDASRAREQADWKAWWEKNEKAVVEQEVARRSAAK